jgi:phenylacetate-CoA ligase
MSLATEARRLLEAMPPGLREPLEGTLAFVPRPLLWGATFRARRAAILAAERQPPEAMRAAQDARVRDLVAWAHARVPYYRRVMDERGIRPEHVRGAGDLRLLPVIDKRTVLDHGDELLARGVSPARREAVSTGGTSGVPLRLWIDRGRSAHEWAFMTAQWGRVGFRPGDRRAVLRGAEVKGRGRLHEWHPLLDELLLSTFQLSVETLPAYLALLERMKPAYLHAYPSSAETLARLLEAVPPARRPRFRGLLLGSENLYPAQREKLARAFACPIYAWYGHSEKVLLGGGCERSTDYHLFPEYGVLEVLDERGEPVAPGETGTIVGTGFLNRVMPFLRYATDDRGTWAADSGPGVQARPCACGRAHPRLAAVEGRWLGERLFGGRGQSFSMTALNTHSRAFDRVARFCIVQERPGEATVLVVAGPGFAATEPAVIAGEYTRRTVGAVRFTVEVVPELPLTARGKFRFIEQRIPEEVQQALSEGRGEVA